MSKPFLKKKDRRCIYFYDFILPKPASVHISGLDLLKIQTLVFSKIPINHKFFCQPPPSRLRYDFRFHHRHYRHRRHHRNQPDMTSSKMADRKWHSRSHWGRIRDEGVSLSALLSQLIEYSNIRSAQEIFSLGDISIHYTRSGDDPSAIFPGLGLVECDFRVFVPVAGVFHTLGLPGFRALTSVFESSRALAISRKVRALWSLRRFKFSSKTFSVFSRLFSCLHSLHGPDFRVSGWRIFLLAGLSNAHLRVPFGLDLRTISLGAEEGTGWGPSILRAVLKMTIIRTNYLFIGGAVPFQTIRYF